MAVKLENANKSPVSGLRWWKEVGWKHIVALVMIAICVFPLLYVMSASFNPGGTLTGSIRLFEKISLENYQTPAGVAVPALDAALVHRRHRDRDRDGADGGRRGLRLQPVPVQGTPRRSLTALLIIQMFPQMLAFVAIFLLLLTIGDIFPVLGIGSLLGLIAVYLGGALGANTFLMYGFFNTIPDDLDEAAKIDGATHAQIFWGMIMPLVTPILRSSGCCRFVGTYGEFILARIILARPENYTLAVGLYVWASDERNAPWSLFAAGAVVAAIPIVLLFMYLQKYIVAGLTAGGVKG